MKRILAILSLMVSGVAYTSDLDIVHEVVSSDPERVSLLLREGADPNLQLGLEKETVLMFAIRNLVGHAEKVYKSQATLGLAKASADLGIGATPCLSGLGISTVFGGLTFLSARAIDVRWAALSGVVGGMNPFNNPRGVGRGVMETFGTLCNWAGTAVAATAASGVVPAAGRAQEQAQEDVAAVGANTFARQAPTIIRNIVTDRAMVTALVCAWTAMFGSYLVWRGLAKGWKDGSSFVKIPSASYANARAITADREIIRTILLHNDLDITIENVRGQTARDVLHEAMLAHIGNGSIYKVLREIDEWIIDVESVAYVYEGYSHA